MGKIFDISDARERHEKAGGPIPTLKGATLADLFAEMGRRLAAQVAPLQTADDLQLLDAPATAAILSMPVARVFELARRKQLGSVRDGRSVRFTRAQIAEYQRKRTIAAR